MKQHEQLRKYNRWRRGDKRLKMPDPKELGELIDRVADRLEVLEREHAMREIKESADMAETFPESEVLNWGEISFATLLDWVTQQKTDGEQDVFSLDVESVQGCFERWWKRSNTEVSGGRSTSAGLAGY